VAIDRTNDTGVILAQGSWFGGWAFYLKDGRPVAMQSVSQRASEQFRVASDEPLPAGPATIEFRFDRDRGMIRLAAAEIALGRFREGREALRPYLAGPVAPAGARGFRVLDAAPYREKTVAGWARRDRVGTLEIKQRGTPVIPDELRRRLRPALTGPTTAAATLVIARIGEHAQAFWCRAEAAAAPKAGV
jgi:hypothetical protein